jgi:hypothetical protein
MNEHKKVVYYTDNKPNLGEDVMYIQHPKTFDHVSGGYGSLINIKNISHQPIKLRFYHTYWSKPALEANRWQFRNQHFLSLFITAISVYCLKKLGQEIVLHTDTEGAKLLSCLPYDQIYIDLDNNKAPITFWASGKFVSILNGETGIHIDTDLFITDNSVISELANNPNVFTNLEETKAYTKLIQDFLNTFDLYDIPHPFQNNLNYSINCGIVKLQDDLKKKYANFYFKFIYHMINNEDIMNKFDIKNQSLYSPDLVIEQLLLKKLLEKFNIQPSFLISIDNKNKLSKNDDKKLCHLLSFEKYILIPFLYNFLKENDPVLFNKIVSCLNGFNFQVSIISQ